MIFCRKPNYYYYYSVYFVRVHAFPCILTQAPRRKTKIIFTSVIYDHLCTVVHHVKCVKCHIFVRLYTVHGLTLTLSRNIITKHCRIPHYYYFGVGTSIFFDYHQLDDFVMSTNHEQCLIPFKCRNSFGQKFKDV